MSSDSFSQKIRFNNRNLAALPVAEGCSVFESVPIKNSIFARVKPDPVLLPRVVASSPSVLALLGLSADDIADERLLAEYFSGNKLFVGSDTAAHCYCGHQFGSFSGQLGDGTVVYLGEAVNKKGEKWELQLKGAGMTPFSRASDGRKVLRSSIREFLASEAMYALGVPTTRAATCVTSDTKVLRDPLYDGRALEEQCTIVSRVAPSFFRFGSFEIFKEGSDRPAPSAGNNSLKCQLLDYVLEYFPDECFRGAPLGSSESYQRWLEEVVSRTASLVAQWQALGWVHGVLNTDNMSILGLTIDYGPYAFMEIFYKDFTPNGSDGSSRYAYSKQPDICYWNLLKLAEAVDPLIPVADGKRIVADTFHRVFKDKYYSLLANKLGLSKSLLTSEEGLRLESALWEAMEFSGADFTDTFRALTLLHEESLDSTLNKKKFVTRVLSRCASPQEASEALRRQIRISRPSMPDRELQYFNQLLLRSDSELTQLFQGADVGAIRSEVQAENEKRAAMAKSSEKLKIVSSEEIEVKMQRDRGTWTSWIDVYEKLLSKDRSSMSAVDRLEKMRANNPTFVLRNWIMQDAIEEATDQPNRAGDYSRVRLLTQMIAEPFNPQFCTFLNSEGTSTQGLSQDDPRLKYCKSAPSWSPGLICTCSS